MKNRVNVIINGKQNLSKVISNLDKLFKSSDTTIVYTKCTEDEVKTSLEKVLNFTSDDYAVAVQYDTWNGWKAENYTDDKSKRLIFIKMPNSLYKSMSHCLNDVFKFIDNNNFARYVHFFFDDLKFKNDEMKAEYNPEDYEWFMDKFNERIIVDGKTNIGNFAFKKASPRFVFASQYLRQAVSFYQYEGKDHFIVNREKFKLNFDEKVKRLYMAEYLIRAHKENVVKHMTFYPDPVLAQIFERDSAFPFTVLNDEISKDFSKDEKYIREELKEEISAESSVDPIIKEMTDVLSTVISEVEKNKSETKDSSAPMVIEQPKEG